MNQQKGSTNAGYWGKRYRAIPTRRVFSAAEYTMSAEHEEKIKSLDDYVRTEVTKYFYLPPPTPAWGNISRSAAGQYKRKYEKRRHDLDWELASPSNTGSHINTVVTNVPLPKPKRPRRTHPLQELLQPPLPEVMSKSDAGYAFLRSHTWRQLLKYKKKMSDDDNSVYSDSDKILDLTECDPGIVNDLIHEKWDAELRRISELTNAGPDAIIHMDLYPVKDPEIIDLTECESDHEATGQTTVVAPQVKTVKIQIENMHRLRHDPDGFLCYDV